MLLLGKFQCSEGAKTVEDDIHELFGPFHRIGMESLVVGSSLQIPPPIGSPNLVEPCHGTPVQRSADIVSSSVFDGQLRPSQREHDSLEWIVGSIASGFHNVNLPYKRQIVSKRPRVRRRAGSGRLQRVRTRMQQSEKHI